MGFVELFPETKVCIVNVSCMKELEETDQLFLSMYTEGNNIFKIHLIYNTGII